MTFKSMVFGASLVASAVALTPAFAQSPQEEAALRQNCSGDYMRLCSQFDPGSVQVEQCFKARAKELSPGCQAAIAGFSKSNPKGRR